MRAGRKLGYAAAIAGGLLLGAAWAASAQQTNPCIAIYDITGLSFSNCVDPPAPIAVTAAETACNNLYTQGYWSLSTATGGAGQFRDQERARILAGLRADGWSTSGVVGSIEWKFEADTETVATDWGYEPAATINHEIATLTSYIYNLNIVLTVLPGDASMVAERQESMERLDVLNDIEGGSTTRVPYYADLPDWVDRNSPVPPSFDPNNAAYRGALDPTPRRLSANVGHFTVIPQWNPTLQPALEILKCEGWSATNIVGSPSTFDSAGILCSLSGWTHTSTDHSNGRCNYRQARDPVWVPDRWVPPLPNPPPDPRPPPTHPGHYRPPVPRYRTTSRDWACSSRTQSITVHGRTIDRWLGGSRAQNGVVWSCRYTYPASAIRNYSSQLSGFGVNLATSSKPANTVGTDVNTYTYNQATAPPGWAVRWVEGTAPQWDPGPCGNKPCWLTLTPEVGMSPRPDQLPVGTPVWIWMNHVEDSCLPDALPAHSDCPTGRLWEEWPTDKVNTGTWRLDRLDTQSGNAHRAVFPEKISIDLAPTTPGGVAATYECLTGGAAGARAPGLRPYRDLSGTPGPLATPLGPLNPEPDACTFTHGYAGAYMVTVTIQWSGMEGLSWPGQDIVWTPPNGSARCPCEYGPDVQCDVLGVAGNPRRLTPYPAGV